jgi:hypothetical protein
MPSKALIIQVMASGIIALANLSCRFLKLHMEIALKILYLYS